MKELVVISGKGGTGKTSVLASFASLAKKGRDRRLRRGHSRFASGPRAAAAREGFTAGSKARIKPGHCTACGKCEELCRFDAIYFDGPWQRQGVKDLPGGHDRLRGLRRLLRFLPENAIERAGRLRRVVCVRDALRTDWSMLSWAVGAENSGKLVTQLRRTAQQVAAEQRRDLILCDGSPGIGCPVIASLTGASLALFVVEPTASGEHDFLRVAQLTIQLGVPGILAVNKADLNEEVARDIEELARQRGIDLVGRIPYDPAVTEAQIARKTVVEASDGPAARAIRGLWTETRKYLDRSAPAAAGGLVPLAGQQQTQRT